MQSIRDGEIAGAFIEQQSWSDFPLAGTQTTQIGFSKYKVFATATNTIAPVASTLRPIGNLLKGLHDTDADESIGIAQSYPTFRMSGLTTTSGKLWFEAEIALNVITTDGTDLFVGLAETNLFTLATAVPLTGTTNGTDASGAMIGFRHLEDGLGTVDTVYNDRATTLTTLGDDEGTMVANTLIKFGMVYDPLETANCVTFYQNGIPLATKLSRTTLIATTNLDAAVLGVMLTSTADTTDAGFWYLSQWRCFQKGP